MRGREVYRSGFLNRRGPASTAAPVGSNPTASAPVSVRGPTLLPGNRLSVAYQQGPKALLGAPHVASRLVRLNLPSEACAVSGYAGAALGV